MSVHLRQPIERASLSHSRMTIRDLRRLPTTNQEPSAAAAAAARALLLLPKMKSLSSISQIACHWCSCVIVAVRAQSRVRKFGPLTKVIGHHVCWLPALESAWWRRLAVISCEPNARNLPATIQATKAAAARAS